MEHALPEGGLHVLLYLVWREAALITNSAQNLLLRNRIYECAGLARFREAALTLDEGLRIDPLNSSMQQLHAQASKGMLGDLLEGTIPTCSPCL